MLYCGPKCVHLPEVILGDFERMDKETSAAEAKAEREWTALSREMQLSLSKKRTALSSTESALARMGSKLQ